MRGYAMVMMGDFADARNEDERALELGRAINSSGVIALANLVLSAVNMYQDQSVESQQRANEHTKRRSR